jgi:hypothetical protein
MKRALLALAVGATMGLSAQAAPLFSQNFDNVASLGGMTTTNSSTPGGLTGYYQGVPEVFTSHSGAADSYIAANYNNAAAGGTINNTLATPFLAMTDAVVLTFWARGANDDGYSDHFKVEYEAQAGGMTTLASDVTALGDWTKYTYIVSGQGGTNGRFNITYFGAADTSDYIGFDTLAVNVPEPSSLALLGVAMAGLLASRRKAGKKA